jgi:hypothetical protein
MSQETMHIVYGALTTEPQTPNEIARTIKLTQKTVQMALFQLIIEKKNIKIKQVGRYRLFWKAGNKK